MRKKPVSKATADERTGGVALGYVEDTFEARTTLADYFSILLDEGGQRRIHHRMPDQLS